MAPTTIQSPFSDSLAEQNGRRALRPEKKIGKTGAVPDKPSSALLDDEAAMVQPLSQSMAFQHS